jgi:2',3'-cyclic-nucleotide 2'-phosphodiesterase (5'-nucleotidase family)
MKFGSRASRHLIASILLAASCSPQGADGPDSLDLVILHVNDTHGALRFTPTEGDEHVGGITRLATLVKEVREEAGERVLLLHAGDIFSGRNPTTLYYGGEVNIRAMNMVGYDALTPGNGEFYFFGIRNLESRATEAGFPFTLANMTYRDSGERPFPPYVIRDVEGVRVAILGLGTFAETRPLARPLVRHDPVKTARELVPKIRESADLVIALTHLGFPLDSVLAREVPGIDIIVGGHSHHRLDEPARIPGPNGEEVVVAQALIGGQLLGRIDVSMERVDGGFHPSRIEGRLLTVHGEIPEDSSVVRLLDEYSELLDEVIFINEENLENPREGDSPLGNLVAEALKYGTGAEVALLDRRAVWGELAAGEVTRSDIVSVHPWRNRVLLLELTGRYLGRALTLADLHHAGCRFRRAEGRVVMAVLHGGRRRICTGSGPSLEGPTHHRYRTPSSYGSGRIPQFGAARVHRLTGPHTPSQ